MKKLRNIIAVVLVSLVVFANTSCQKYQDGPFLSIRTKTNRVAGTWKVDNYKKNGNDLTSLMSGYVETFSNDGNYSYIWGPLDGTGKWAFQSNSSEIRITGTSNQSSQTLIILKLEEKQFWYYYMDGNDKKEFHMIQN